DVLFIIAEHQPPTIVQSADEHQIEDVYVVGREGVLSLIENQGIELAVFTWLFHNSSHRLVCKRLPKRTIRIILKRRARQLVEQAVDVLNNDSFSISHLIAQPIA